MFPGRGARRARSFEAALRDLKSSDARVRASAAQDLAPHAGERRDEVTDALLDALGDGDPQVRGAAAIALADAGSSSAVPDLIDKLDDDDAHVRQMALMALGELRSLEASEAVARLLEAPEPPVRFQAVMAFPRVCQDPARALDALLAATRDEDPLVVHIALRMAEEIGVDMLERARELLDHESAVVRVGAAVMLGENGSREGADVLVATAIKALHTSEFEDEASAVELCGKLGLKEAIPGLELRAFGGVFSRDPFGWHARVALAAMKNERAVRWVLAELNAWTRERRSLAVAAAMRARVEAARPKLTEMRGRPERADPEAVEQALAALDSPERSRLNERSRGGDLRGESHE
jgi:hypothetical protein